MMQRDSLTLLVVVVFVIQMQIGRDGTGQGTLSYATSSVDRHLPFPGPAPSRRVIGAELHDESSGELGSGGPR
jgi:hypothetical protein